MKMDANAELGKKINPSDKKDQSKNGKLLEKVIIEKGSATDLCKGIISRTRLKGK